MSGRISHFIRLLLNIMVHAVQSNQQHDVHTGVADSTAHPAADRLRVLAGVHRAAIDHWPR